VKYKKITVKINNIVSTHYENKYMLQFQKYFTYNLHDAMSRYITQHKTYTFLH